MRTAPIDAIDLGATLYLPATRSDLVAVAAGRHPNLRSAVICFEDSVRSSDVPGALVNLAQALSTMDAGLPYPALFVRPRDEVMLRHILGFRGVDKLTGFVIPKVTIANLPLYLRSLPADRFWLMPTLETREALDASEACRLRDQLLAIQSRVLALRIGGNDLLQLVGARRSPVRTAYEGPLGGIITGLVSTFAPYGFALSAPVFENFGNSALLREEVDRDIEHGLLTKTVIHPSQIDLIQAAYAVDPNELEEARLILARNAIPVFASRGAMCEPQTHKRWAETILRRAESFGVSSGRSGVASSARTVDRAG